ncbi:hypothetical protein BJY59DRAFT_60575 [Rhodotorula toruloides]
MHTPACCSAVCARVVVLLQLACLSLVCLLVGRSTRAQQSIMQRCYTVDRSSATPAPHTLLPHRRGRPKHRLNDERRAGQRRKGKDADGSDEKGRAQRRLFWGEVLMLCRTRRRSRERK